MKLNKTEIEKTMSKENADIPGVSIAYIDNVGTVSTDEIGSTDKNRSNKVEVNTVFGAASLSKPVMVYLALKLIALKMKGHEDFNLDSVVNDILPFEEFCKQHQFKWSGTDSDVGRLKSVTLSTLMSHTSGLDLITDNRAVFHFNPAEQYCYSGLGIYYLQAVVEKEFNMSLEELAQKYVFGPEALGMTHTTFTPELEPGKTAPAVAANNLCTTAHDYALFVKAWMKDSKTLMKEAFDPKIQMTNDEWAKAREVDENDLEHVAWGLGWGLETNEKDDVIRAYHTGDMNEWRGSVAMNLEDGTAIVYFANSILGHALADQIITPNVELEHGYNYFFQKYGFARKIDDAFELALMSEPERTTGKIYLECTKDALVYEFLDSNGQTAHISVPWEKLPENLPRSTEEMIQLKGNFLPTILMEQVNMSAIDAYIASRNDKIENLGINEPETVIKKSTMKNITDRLGGGDKSTPQRMPIREAKAGSEKVTSRDAKFETKNHSSEKLLPLESDSDIASKDKGSHEQKATQSSPLTPFSTKPVPKGEQNK